MAYFKLALLTSQFEDNKNVLLQDIISEFNTQENVYISKKALEDPSTEKYELDSSTNYDIKERKYSFCYSYDEKFSLTQNAQKTLTFNLDKFITRENLREENPFARNIIIGSQLLLVDQYGNNYFFTVKGIDYDIKETNITYKISCQDTFSYQMTRQNAGYTIDNNPSESDFIGAKTIDWWVVNKIVPECHIGYNYLYMQEGLCEIEYIDLVTNKKVVEYQVFNYGDNLNDVKRIIKDAYSPDKDKDLYETIPFSCSGSNANAALISLGDTLDLQLKTFEHISGLKYFWFEPKKNTNRIGGLVYSPYNSIQSFGLSHKGDSLTTILNVEGPTYDDELITLIPELTPHFSNFINNTSWYNHYKKGMFLEQCEPQHYVLNDKLNNDQAIDNQFLYYTTMWNISTNTYNPVTATNVPNFNSNCTYGSDEGFLYIRLFNSSDHDQQDVFKLNSLFTKVSFNINQASVLTIDSNNNPACSSDKVRWSLTLIKDDIGSYQEIDFIDGDDIKDYINDSSFTIWFKIFIGAGRTGRIYFRDFSPNLSFYREVSQEDIEFANAAEECPWLENKLINFNYFLENKMITEDEYRNLMNLLTQDLRIINGKLMFHAKAYYKALHDRTKLLADLTNQLDVLGAAANADIVTTLRTAGKIVEDADIYSFRDAYKNTVLSNIQDKQELLNYDDILTNYFNKFFNSEQRFLKNIKKFKDYFNSLPSTWLDPSAAFYTYKLSIESETSYIINAPYDKKNLTGDIVYVQKGDKKGIPIFQIYHITELNNEIIEASPYYPVTIDNFNSYYIKNNDGTGKETVKEGELYNTAWAYYQYQDDVLIPYTDLRSEILANIISGGGVCYYRDITPEVLNFTFPDTTPEGEGEKSPIDWMVGSGGILTQMTKDEYKEEFPVSEIYLDTHNNNYDHKALFVNGENFDNFYKLNINKKWKKEPRRIRYDIFKNWKGNEGYDDSLIKSKFIFCSSVIPSDGYTKSTDGSIWLKPTMGITYTCAEENTEGNNGSHLDFVYKDTAWFKTLRSTSKINKNGIYKVFEIGESINEEVTKAFFDRNLSWGTITFWPIYNELQDCDLIRDKEKEVDSLNLSTLLSGWAQNVSKPSPESGFYDYLWEKVSNSKCPFDGKFIIVEITDYRLSPFVSGYETSKVYVDENDRLINFNNYAFPRDASTSAYYHRVKPYIHPSESDTEKEFDLEYGEYYKKDDGGNYSRIYTAAQLPSSSYRTLNRSVNVYNYLTPYETKIIVPLQKITYKRDENNEQIIDFEKSKTQDYIIYFTTDEVHNTPSPYLYLGINAPELDIMDNMLIINEVQNATYYRIFIDGLQVADIDTNIESGITILPSDRLYPTIKDYFIWQEKEEKIEDESIEFKLTKYYDKAITAETNGQLWQLCSSGGDLARTPYAVNIAANIEAELEQYWQQAYAASLYCRYFLPESWQPTYNKDQNLFSNDIIGKDENGKVYLKNTYIPDVSIYSQNGKTVLPKYYISRGQKNEYHIDDKSIDSETRIDSTIFSSNPVIRDFINYLGEDPQDFYAAESGTTTYYYIADKDAKSGCTWSQLMLRKVNTEFMDYSGHYDLAYRLIKQNYMPLVLDEYEKLKYNKQVLWDTIYQIYGYLMLEQTYKNETATNSSELMTLAKYAFKDYAAPERQYNITVIDATSLKGYKGDEIRIGDGIQIDAQAYYNEYDQIFKSLSQYLFITDISYTLRSPTDISLTVNSIKYQDKLIQRLVKLIK